MTSTEVENVGEAVKVMLDLCCEEEVMISKVILDFATKDWQYVGQQ